MPMLRNGSIRLVIFGDDDYAVSASQTGGGDNLGYENADITAGTILGRYENMSVTGPGITQTAGTKMGISGTATITAIRLIFVQDQALIFL